VIYRIRTRCSLVDEPLRGVSSENGHGGPVGQFRDASIAADARLVSQTLSTNFAVMPKQSNVVLAAAAAAEAATGLVLIAYPAIVFHLLFGAQPVGLVEVVSRFAGIPLFALGTACWPWPGRAQDAAFLAMAGYSTLAAAYFAVLRIVHAWVGPLLALAALFHAVLSILLVREWLASHRPRTQRVRPTVKSAPPTTART
jgi:hypothetical protein